ncbi:MAG: hypothetical protein AAGJ37_15290 [Pseudomonadota bacterium]
MAAMRLIVSGLIAFVFYAGWAWYANSLVVSDHQQLIKAALVQGGYSGAMTFMFTAMLEYFFKKMGANSFCLVLITPRWSTHTERDPCATKETFIAALKQFAIVNKKSIAGKFLVPLPALFIQSVLVFAVNIYFRTPNLILTVLPSIIFSGVYGYSYALSISKKTTE